MIRKTWNQVRSEFNHAWLKNRVLITLWKAQSVLVGTVEDESIWEDLDSLVAEWRRRYVDAQNIIDDFARTASPTRELHQSYLSALDDDTKNWLGQLADQRWRDVEHSEAKALRAAAALSAFDHEVRTLSSFIPFIRCGQETASAKACLARLQSTTKELAEALSELGTAGN